MNSVNATYVPLACWQCGSRRLKANMSRTISAKYGVKDGLVDFSSREDPDPTRYGPPITRVIFECQDCPASWSAMPIEAKLILTQFRNDGKEPL